MTCRVCGSGQQKAFPSEINIHPPRGLKYLTDPGILAYPSLLVCFGCGFTEFVLKEAERYKLAERY